MLHADLCPPLSAADELRVRTAAGLKFMSLDTAAMALQFHFPGWRVERPRGENMIHLFDPLGWKRMIVRERIE